MRLKIKKLFKILGPGIITGAADDDPSGIATYSLAGAQFGPLFLWTAIVSWPLMAAVQNMCARIGMASGQGLAQVSKRKIPKYLVVVICFALFAANTLNVAANTLAMADAFSMLTGVPAAVFIVIIGIGITWATVQLRYESIASVMKWLALGLFAYIFATFDARPDWNKVLTKDIIPTVPKTSAGWSMLVAILGTTISPYLFFWQTALEIEANKLRKKEAYPLKIAKPVNEDYSLRFADVMIGTFFSNVVMFFIILLTGITLHVKGITNVETTRQVAEALEPLAGRYAMLFYALGIIGSGFLSIPTLTGSAAYAFAETFNWKQGLDEKFDKARRFYFVVFLSMVIAIAVDFLKVNPLKMLYGSAVVNGLLAPFLLVLILFIATDKKIMQGQTTSRASRLIVVFTTILMFMAGIGMFIF